MKKSFILGACFGYIVLLIVSRNSFAFSESELKNYFDQHILSFDQKLSTVTLDNNSTSPTFFLADMNVQLSANASFGITSILSLSISPEIDFMVTPAVSP